MVVDTKQLAVLLGIKSDIVRNYKAKNKLIPSLERKGYKLISEYKEGRKVFFVIEHLKANEIKMNDKELICSNVFNVKHEKFPSFYVKQTSISQGVNSNLCAELTTTGMSKTIGVDRETVKRWKDILRDMDIIVPDGIIYVRIGKGSMDRSTREEYASYLKAVRIEKANHTVLMLAYKEGKVSKELMENKHQEYMDNMEKLMSSYVVRIKTDKLNIFNPIHQQVIRIFLGNS